MAESALAKRILVNIVERGREIDVGKTLVIAEGRIANTKRRVRHVEVVERRTLEESVILNGLQLTLSIPLHLLQSRTTIECCIANGVKLQRCAVEYESLQTYTHLECLFADVLQLTFVSHIHTVKLLCLYGSIRLHFLHSARYIDTLQLVLTIKGVASHLCNGVLIALVYYIIWNIYST